ncbi:MAG: bifunctional riboflavin kinase/FAD synthetase [Hungatella hathewayi]|nr:bifunctional riboflavin kinase/FAD synthetase [Hungatella hathewayi]
MIYISDTRDFKIEEPTVVTIGKFDGRHKGHQKLLREMLRMKREYGLATAVFTFSTAPVALIQDRPQTVITTNQERRNNMEKMGIDYLVEYPFSKEVAHLPPEEFVSHILLGQMNAKAIVVGTDCGFGYQRAGNAKLLRELAPKYGYILEVIDKAREDNRDISSTYIKEELDMGAIEKANELLGEPYAIHGTVVHGNHIGGAVLGFPTVNILPPPEKHLPPFGVYVSRVLIDGTYYGGITNIGKKPTVEGEYPVGVETFVFDFDRDIYGKNIEVQLLHFERPEQKFASLEDLKRQLEKDKEYGLRYLKEHGLA